MIYVAVLMDDEGAVIEELTVETNDLEAALHLTMMHCRDHADPDCTQVSVMPQHVHIQMIGPSPDHES